jgi:hypothetical protein
MKMKNHNLKFNQLFSKRVLKISVFYLAVILSSQTVFSQVGKSTGLELGFCAGGITNIPGQNGLFTGAIFKEFMKYNKKKVNKTGILTPTYGLEMKLNWSYYSNDAGGMNVFTLPATFKFNLGSKMDEQSVVYNEKTNTKVHNYTKFRAIYLYAGPELGYISTNITKGLSKSSPVFGGVVGGIQIWFNRFKIDIYGQRSLTSVFTPGSYYVQGAAIAFGFAF